MDSFKWNQCFQHFAVGMAQRSVYCQHLRSFFSSNRADCAMAILEGIAFEVFECYDVLYQLIQNNTGDGIRTIRSIGGLS